MTKKKQTYKSSKERQARRAVKKASMFDAMKGIFTLANVQFATWKLSKLRGIQEYDGHCLVFGCSNADGPYTQFCFNEDGKLVEAASINDVTHDKQVVVNCIGKKTMTTTDYTTDTTTTIDIEES